MLSDLRRLVGGEHVLDGADAREELHDMTLLRGRADAVVRPGSAEEVAAVVAWCCERGVAIVPRGGGTGFAGGATPLGGGVVVALDRLDRVRAFEPLLWRAHVEAGVRTATVQRLARENGLVFPVDPGAAEQSQIGGNIATNAGGPHCFKYGVMRFWVLGLEAVLAPGELVRLGGAARKDVAGYDLTGLLCGSEGTLGIVTAAWLRLMPAPPVSLPVCGVFADAAAGAGAIERLLGSGVVPAAIEYLDAAAVRLAGGGFPGGLPDGGGFLVLAEADGSEDEARELAEALGPGVLRPEPAALWRWRDGVSHAVSAARGGKVSEDVAVPVDRLAEGVERTLEIGARHGLEACSWGHAGDGNLHSTFLVVPGDEDELRRADAAAEDLLEMAIELGGTITGEHGVGVRKNGFLSRQWAPAAVAAHRAVKAALDPHGVFNPGKKLP
ncbi:MAG TPA: FAD-linked oxidase C-terminal domain-containing protein [Solirubrobacteraceae bacterium]|nr:FAD-linked oxidase C-terminal domain-containing protein [Solirubrobacteraceae bacterium]